MATTNPHIGQGTTVTFTVGTDKLLNTKVISIDPGEASREFFELVDLTTSGARPIVFSANYTTPEITLNVHNDPANDYDAMLALGTGTLLFTFPSASGVAGSLSCTAACIGVSPPRIADGEATRSLRFKMTTTETLSAGS